MSFAKFDKKIVLIMKEIVLFSTIHIKINNLFKNKYFVYAMLLCFKTPSFSLHSKGHLI